MTQSMTRRAFGAAALAAPFVIASGPGRAADPVRLRLSVDTSPTHGRTISCGEYLKKLEAASNGRIKTELFASGQLFNDRDVTKALLQGQVEMAVPGNWTLSGFVPSADFLNLPPLYGQPIEVAHRIVDGKPGALVNAMLEKKLRVHVLGPWLDLGFSHWFSTTKPLNSLADLRGMKLRNSGGAAQAWRAQFFGAIPNTTPWPDVPLALSQGTFDGLGSTDESIASAQLWDAGMHHTLQDRQAFSEYLPLVSGQFWASLPPDLQKLMTDTWAENIGPFRTRMAAAQDKAVDSMREHKVTVVSVPQPELDRTREKMMVDYDKLVAMLNLDPQVAQEVAAASRSVG